MKTRFGKNFGRKRIIALSLVAALLATMCVWAEPDTAYADNASGVPTVAPTISSADNTDFTAGIYVLCVSPSGFDMDSADETVYSYMNVEAQSTAGDWISIGHSTEVSYPLEWYRPQRTNDDLKALGLSYSNGDTVNIRVSYCNTAGVSGPYNTTSITYVNTAEEARERAESIEKADTTITARGNDLKEPAVGDKATWENDLFKLTAEVTKAGKNDFTVQCELTSYFEAAGYSAYIADVYAIDKNGDVKDAHVGEGMYTNQGSNGTISSEFYIHSRDFAKGPNYLRFCVMSGDGGYSRQPNEDFVYLYFVARPLKPAAPVATKVTKNSVTFKKAYKEVNPQATGSGTTIFYKKKGAAKWLQKKFSAGGTMTISGLSPDTVYQFQAQSYVTGKMNSGKSVTTVSPKSATKSFTTAAKSAPTVVSVQAVNLRSVDRVHLEGSIFEWSDSIGVYDIKITLKNLPKNQKYIALKSEYSSEKVVKLKGNTYTIKGITYAGSGSTPYVQVATVGNKVNSRYLGYSPYSKKQVGIVK